ncbi:Hpt domain-containing protein [Sphingomonas japonica]|uniref:HPt (Histidine-containing phosphotransfer) domain-containing protein n=1 Tax=Sphingomonas japonica TaxID=511662 RepID=A0ABX0TWZ4_9SPHN|nr:Hpt domain-containing protein [Sphingomonas japonica]NIJ22830.1 HPt (histidine-containing phosphotransfer) domain-containing protein [Sphingomonas japonica]
MPVTKDGEALIDWSAYAQARAELGANFVRILGYFREDGIKSVSAIETAMRGGIAAGLVIPAHTLKGESRQFGAEILADLAETIETIARTCVENHDQPDEALEHVVALRPLFLETLTQLEREANPLAVRRPAQFGRRSA